ncbi:hypothetical protein [Paenibacillus caui]|uniref:hypothetical protein n=1 Tax=Paenibacillus caui TaxID=2873927 RepID=UPI001CA84FDF|nr:hypothetical protein [Paenibacillus caui]
MIDRRIFPNKQEVWEWQQVVGSYGPRLTGNLAHENLINYFQTELAKMGLEVHRDHHLFKKWEAKSWGLSVLQEDGSFEQIPVAFYYPYSGETPTDGITGEMSICGKGPAI